MMPINTRGAAVGTVSFWQSAKPYYGARSWKGAMKAFAAQHGVAVAMLANDGALIMERDKVSGLVKAYDYQPEEIRWIH